MVEGENEKVVTSMSMMRGVCAAGGGGVGAGGGGGVGCAGGGGVGWAGGGGVGAGGVTTGGGSVPSQFKFAWSIL